LIGGAVSKSAPPRFPLVSSDLCFGCLAFRYSGKTGCIMKPEFDPSREAGDQFHTTRWTLVMVSAQSQAAGGKAALSELCRIYWYPLYSFARRRGQSPHDAQDLTQGFFLHLLEHRALTQVDRMKGKFRSFLLASFQNYLSNEAQNMSSSLWIGKMRKIVTGSNRRII
jgi:Sigma-70 region 2